VFEGYLALEKEYPERILGIDASRTIDEIKADIYKKLEEVLNGVSE
jgi:dTMP kinase